MRTTAIRSPREITNGAWHIPDRLTPPQQRRIVSAWRMYAVGLPPRPALRLPGACRTALRTSLPCAGSTSRSQNGWLCGASYHAIGMTTASGA
jgi:hypothetical protein